MKLDPAVTRPVIGTDRFDLRALRLSDTGIVGLHMADKRVAGQTESIPHPLPPGATEAFIARAVAGDRPADVWAIDASRVGGSEVLGLITLARLERGQSEISYWVAPAFWNTGVASVAVDALLTANPHQARTVFASVFQDNPASARVLSNCGFRYLGDAEAFCVARNATLATWTYSRKAD